MKTIAIILNTTKQAAVELARSLAPHLLVELPEQIAPVVGAAPGLLLLVLWLLGFGHVTPPSVLRWLPYTSAVAPSRPAA